MRPIAIALLLPFLAAAAPDRAPPPPAPDTPPETLTPAQLAAQDMLLMYEEFCLTRFPSPDAFQQGVAAHNLATASDADASDALLGRPGTAWTTTTPHGTFVIALETTPHQGCAVTGPGGDDAGIHAAFELAVESFAQSHEFGMLTRPPEQHGKVAGRDATLQILGATPDSRPRQAFVNMQSTTPNGAPLLRLTRELAPK
jgi:hypothetical protein